MKIMNRLLAVGMAVLLLAGCTHTATSKYALAQAKYPELTDYAAAYDKVVEMESSPNGNWSKAESLYRDYSDAWGAYVEELEALRADAQETCPDLTAFSAETVGALFKGRQENTVYSPANLYLALSMLAEATDGDTRAQITALLGAGDSRAAANALWRMLYATGRTSTIPANSMWVGEVIPVKQTLADTLAQHYYADSFKVPMGTEDADKAMAAWLNDHTGNLLEDAARGIHSDPETVLTLMSTLYYKALWSNEFRRENTHPDTFTMADGTEITADFMHEQSSGAWHKGDGYTAVNRSFQGAGGRMLFVLPDEGVTPEELLGDPKVVAELLTSAQDEYTRINWSVPKFDVSSSLKLSKQLQALGVTLAFDPTVSDFTPTTEDVPVALTQVQHAARVTIDENGCTAAAFTVMMMNGAGRPPESVLEFHLDRPFLFFILNDNDIPLFVGTVYKP